MERNCKTGQVSSWAVAPVEEEEGGDDDDEEKEDSVQCSAYLRFCESPSVPGLQVFVREFVPLHFVILRFNNDP
jgi:hypothetical protein